jgi:hypothetical protein
MIHVAMGALRLKQKQAARADAHGSPVAQILVQAACMAMACRCVAY